jgi:hypothetical protein
MFRRPTSPISRFCSLRVQQRPKTVWFIGRKQWRKSSPILKSSNLWPPVNSPQSSKYHWWKNFGCACGVTVYFSDFWENSEPQRKMLQKFYSWKNASKVLNMNSVRNILQKVNFVETKNSFHHFWNCTSVSGIIHLKPSRTTIRNRTVEQTAARFIFYSLIDTRYSTFTGSFWHNKVFASLVLDRSSKDFLSATELKAKFETRRWKTCPRNRFNLNECILRGNPSNSKVKVLALEAVHLKESWRHP